MIKANGLFTNVEVKAKKVFSFSFHFLVLFNFFRFFFGGGGIIFCEEEMEKRIRTLGKRNCRWDLKGVKYSKTVWSGMARHVKSIKGDIINVIKREPVKQ